VPVPSERDVENAARRQAIAERQAEEYARVLGWAQAAFGPGWEPSHRHYLVDKDEEERCRRSGERPRAAATVYTVRHRQTGAARHFIVSDDGRVTECESYQAGFGPMLFEAHPSRGFEHGGKFCPYQRYSLCWAGYELYRPRSAEQLAALRASRERGKAERAEKRWAEENPLLAWAEKEGQEEGLEDHRAR
jgi:hypothetical protein